MKILTIPLLAHDASICILEDGKIFSYKMEERFSGKKHDGYYDCILGKIANKNILFDKVIVTKGFDESYPEDLLLEKLKTISYKELIFENGIHHLYHAYSGFYNSGFDEAICFSIDGSGAILKDNNVEIETVYHLNKNKKEKKIYKKIREHKNYNNYEKYLFSINDEDLSVGEKYQKLSKLFGYNPIDGAGKIMGFGQYKHYENKLEIPYNTKEWVRRLDIAYDLQQETQNYILDLIKKCIKETGIKNVVISGGYGLNCVANYHYLKNLNDINLYIDPICFDAGISIGAAYYHYIQSTQNNPQILPIENVYIGHKEEVYDLTGLKIKKVSYEDIVDLLLQQNMVALFQGSSEAGQRALGNRSLLFDSRNPKGKDIVNRIKRREKFRPFAGTILQEQASNWFNMLSLKESPYMQYAIDAYQNAIEKVPAIIHADNTCRIQTVTEKQNKHFYNLINCFFEKTGVPMLLNTSFNLGGQPLVETFEHAICTLENSQIEYLYLPEIKILVTIENKKNIYL